MVIMKKRHKHWPACCTRCTKCGSNCNHSNDLLIKLAKVIGHRSKVKDFEGSMSASKGPATRNDFVNDIVNDARADAIFATLKAIVDDEKSTISSTISLRVAWP